MPLLRKQPFVKSQPPAGLKPEDEVFFCETTKEVFLDYEAFFERTILCNSLVWSCSVTGKSNLTYEEAAESEAKSRKKISNLPKGLKKGLLYLVSRTRRGRQVEVVDDVYDWAKSRYFKGEIVDAVIGNQWCESKILRVIPPTEAEIAADKENEVAEVNEDGSPKEEQGGPPPPPPEHLFKYEVEETEPDDEDMVELHIIEADDIKREKGLFSREKLNLYLKSVIELDGAVFKVKPKVSKLYNLESLKIEDVFAGPEPQFEESMRKIAAVMSKKKGQCTLDGWATATAAKKEGKVKEMKDAKVTKPKKQTPEEIEEEMRKLREAQAKYREDQEKKKEEMKKKRIEDRAKEAERKKEEKRLVKELIEEWSSRREDLDCDDLKALPVPTPVRSRIPNQLTGDVFSLLEFINSFSEILEVKDSYPGQGVTFQELEKALTETETCEGAFFDILSFMLVTLFDLQLEEEEEAKADTDKTADDLTWAGDLGKDEVIVGQITRATEAAAFPRQHLGLSLREVHLDQWSITEVLRLHLEGSGGYRGWNLQNWRHNNRGGFKLQDDPGFQFCLDEPQILGSLREKSVFELNVSEKLKILVCMVNQMLSFAGVRDEIDTRNENVWETRVELRRCRADENKRIKEHETEEKRIAKEERKKLLEEKVKEAEAKKQKKNNALEDRLKKEENAAVIQKEVEAVQKSPEKKQEKVDEGPRMTSRQLNLMKEKEKEREATILKEKEAEAASRDLGEDAKRMDFLDREREIQVGECRSEDTPWRPDSSGPLTEEQATEKARQIMREKAGLPTASPSSDKENSSKKNDPSVNKSDNAKTYSKKNPVLVQKVLTFNKEDGKSPKKVKEEQLVKEEVEEKEVTPPWGRCLANSPDCPVHSVTLPRIHWAFYSSAQEVDELVNSLNPRGDREGELRDRLVAQRERIERRMKKCQVSVLSRSQEDCEQLGASMEAEEVKRRNKAAPVNGSALPLGTSMQDIMELALRDQILELEEKIFVGALGFLKSAKEEKLRSTWRNSIETKSYRMLAEHLEWGEDGRLEAKDLEDEEGGLVKQMAAAILQVEQMISTEDIEKYLKEPLGEGEKERKKRQKKEEEREKRKAKAEEAGEEFEEDEDSGSSSTPLKKWESSLMACTNLSQLFVHLTTLDNSIVWSKSVMNTKCRICRRKTDPDRMLLCDGCDRGHHMYCLKPPLKKVPEGEWFCPECKPKERIRSPKKKVRNRFSMCEEEDEDMEQDEDDDQESSPPSKKSSSKSRKKLRVVESDDEDDDEEPKPKKDKKKSQKRKSVIESDEDEAEEDTPPRRGGRSRKKVQDDDEDEEEVDSPPLKKKVNDSAKKGLSNLFGKRQAAIKSDERRRGDVEEADDDDDEQETKSRSSRRARASKDQENKENSRAKSKRARDDDEEDLDLNIGEMDELVKALMKHKDGWPFERPITKQEAPDYLLCVKTPMDLSTIRSRMDGNIYYSRNQEILDDIRLVFSNCFQYNQEDAEEYKCAVRLEKYFDKELDRVGMIDENQYPKAPKSKKRRA